MLQCAREGCGAKEATFRSGNLYLADVIETNEQTATRRVIKKFVWLCASCAESYTVQSWRPPGQQICQRTLSLHQVLGDLAKTG